MRFSNTWFAPLLIGALLLAACGEIDDDSRGLPPGDNNASNNNNNTGLNNNNNTGLNNNNTGNDDGVNKGTLLCDDGAPIVFKAIVRDFRKGTGSDCNPDFNRTESGERSETGIVKDMLGSDGKPVFNKPNGLTTTTAENFNQWYNTVPGINMEYTHQIELTPDPNNPSVWSFDTNRFFPLGNTAGIGSAPGDRDDGGQVRNFRFTTEFRMTFKYRAGQVFTFRGDDDVFVFIDKRLVIDIGGIHSPLEASVNLDTLGLVAGQDYDMDIFHAERNPTGSNFRITTNIECIKPVVIN